MRTDQFGSNKKFYVEPGKALGNLLARLSLIADELEHVTIRRVQLGQSTPFAWKYVIASTPTYAAPPSSSQPSIGAASAVSTLHSAPTSRRRAVPQVGQRRSVASRSGSPGPLIADSTRAPQFGQVSCSCVLTGMHEPNSGR